MDKMDMYDSIFDPPDTETEEDQSECRECEDCGHKIAVNDEDYIQSATGKAICEECSDQYVFCESDEEWLHEDDAIQASDTEQYHHVHSSSLYTCDDCGNVYTYNVTCDYSTDNDHNTVCEHCLNSGDYSYCEDIEQYVYGDNAHYSDSDDCCYYYEENVPENRVGALQCYSADVLEVIGRYCYVNGQQRGTFGDSLVLGVELETDTRGHTDIVATMDSETNLSDYAICKSDATCSGPEIVTLPADLHSHKHTFSWDAWCEVLRPIARGYHGGDNGIHIHANRAAMSATTLGKVLVFMNHRDNVPFVEVIAQRSLNGWCSTNGLKYTSVAKSAAEPSDGKYSAVNVTQRTAEFRIFNSSLLPNRIYKNLEFVDALIRYCARASEDHRESYMLPYKFIQYVHTNAITYPYLSEFIRNRWQ